MVFKGFLTGGIFKTNLKGVLVIAAGASGLLHPRIVSTQSVPVPKIPEERCTGCGRCAYNCPVKNQADVVVTLLGAIRMDTGSFKEQGERQGLNISLKHKRGYSPQRDRRWHSATL